MRKKGSDVVVDSAIVYNQDWSPKKEPRCLQCKAELPREIKITGIHDPSCPWNYYIECKCGSQNNLSKLLGFWAGCSDMCEGRT